MADDAKHEIVIIRRGGHGDHDEHHGGVWKIAFADFMTAMMAFFLVMWLISANDKTRASIARYFNPVRLVDATTQPRGLHDPKKDENGITASPDTKVKGGEATGNVKEAVKAAEGAASETPQGRVKRLDETMRENPLAALAEIAAGRGASDSPPADVVRSSLPVIGRKGGPAYRDPFAPQTSPPPGSEVAEAVDGEPAKPAADVNRDEASAHDKSLADQLAASLGKAASAGGPDLAVQATNEGLLVKLTDTDGFSMFASGSAVPAKRVVLLMERIAAILAAKPGSVVIRGYTDNKKFRGKTYDNWHLSVDRAQAAHYMLLRGGLPDVRIATIEGFADHGAKAGVDPASPLNRRIEILLKDEPK